MRGVAQQPRTLGAQLEDLGDGAIVVVPVAVVAAIHERAPDALAQVALRRVGQERFDARTRVEDRPLALASGRFGRGGGGRAQRFRQAIEVAFLLQEGGLAAFLGEDVLSELRVERREALVDRRQALLRSRIETRAGAHEVREVEPREALLLGAEAGPFAGLVDRGDAREQRRILRDAVAELGELRCHLALDGLHRGIVHVRGEHAEQRADAVELAARLLECGNGVIEAGGLRIRGDAFDRGELQRHRGFERGLQPLRLHLIPGRHAAVGAGPGGKQRGRRNRGRVAGGRGGRGGDAGSQRAAHDGEQQEGTAVRV